MTIYRGFTTRQNAKKYVLTDYELAKQDLINYFNIRKGQKLMQPNFGTIIWDLLFEPLNEDTRQAIQADVTKIVSYDPRLRIGQVAVTQENNGLLIQITLGYISSDQTETLSLNFNSNSSKLTVN